MQKLRIHGDNILECEKALNLLVSALEAEGKAMVFVGEAAYAPVYRIETKEDVFEIQLFPGYDRWGINLKQYLADNGAVLREATDATVNILVRINDELYEKPILAFEFCGALPAGNNAWQRCGRALASAYVRIPYLYFAEIGGAELDTNREIKASRLPNPLVPFSYLSLGETENTIAIPVFIESASLDDNLRKKIGGNFGSEEAIKLIRSILYNHDQKDVIKKLKEYAINVIRILANSRKRNGCLSEAEWNELYKRKTGRSKAEWLVEKDMHWHKKVALRPITKSFLTLLKLSETEGAVAIGSRDMPLCLIPERKRRKYAEGIKHLYKKRISLEFMKWVSRDDKPLVCVWLAGFKPRGDDSRPDRGLVPLARMIFGRHDVDLLSIVYGPANPITWEIFKADLWRLSKINGLWEAILGLSDGVLIDTPTNRKMQNIGQILNKSAHSKKGVILKAANLKPSFGEQDVDSVIHCLFSNSIKFGVYEGLCNPPGGDWSGICMIDFNSGFQYKWTSLPRVSEKNTKRPDHLIQFKDPDVLLSIESKDEAATLETGIGLRLKKYVELLIKHQPIAIKQSTDNEWEHSKKRTNLRKRIISGAAFLITNHEDMGGVLKRAKTDIIFGLEFLLDSNKVVIHILASKNGESVIPIIKKIGEGYKDLFDIRIVKN